MIQFSMVEVIKYVPVTLGGMIKSAQERIANGTLTTATPAESRLTDIIDISDAAKQKLGRARKVGGYLQAFDAFFRALNRPMSSYNSGVVSQIKKTTYQKDV